MPQDDRIKREIEQRLQNGKHHPPMPDFVRPIYQNGRMTTSPPMKESEPKPKPEAEKPILRKKNGFDILKMFNFGNMKIDNDVILIVILILVLSSEDNDTLLLLALAYIML